MKKIIAFTLAETLIAIGIIGVVSALTIPTLIQKYEKTIIEKNLAKTYSELKNVIKQSEADNGSYEGWDYTLSQKDFVNTYFAPYMKMRLCKSGECFAKKHGGGYYDVWLLPNGELQQEGIWNVTPKYITLDGRHIGIYNETFGLNPPTVTTAYKYNAIYIMVDANGSAGKSIMGQDVFFMAAYNYLYGRTMTSSSKGLHMGLTCMGACSIARLKQLCYLKTSNRRECGALIEKNNWKFPSDYPFEYSKLKDSL
jgi:type II secretory pathway pseudopilin PulG